MKQGGTRRGANMGILRVDHPDIMDFITCKEDLTKVTNFNISVAVTDDVHGGGGGGRDVRPGRSRAPGRSSGQLDAREVWDKIIHGAWRTGEPGVFFIDEANHYNPVPHLGSYEATNPCGEQPLLPYDVCNLGSINVGAFVKDGRDGLGRASAATSTSRTHFLDNVIDVNKYPLPEIDRPGQAHPPHRARRHGLRRRCFVRLGIAYDSDEGVELGRK